MRRSSPSVSMAALLLMLPVSVAAQTATVHRRLLLHADSAVTSRAIERLDPGTTITLLATTHPNGYYHVRAPDDSVGWVYGHYIVLDAVASGPSGGAAGGDAASTSSCGVQRWPVKVMSDFDASTVDMTPMETSVDELRALPRPGELPHSHRAPAERHVYTVHATLIGWLAESDSDLHLVLAAPGDSSETIIAEIPAASCAESAADSLVEDFRSARATVLQALGRAPSGYAELIDPLHVTVTGVAFFDFPHHQHGLAPNAIELHPVLRIEIEE
jgi:hypothetical protein